jgi:sucrose phosphorylase
LKRYFSDTIGGIHLLPFYPSSADRGFSPITYGRVDPSFGSWRDIEKIGTRSFFLEPAVWELLKRLPKAGLLPFSMIA